MAISTALRLAAGPLGEYHSEPPWASFELSPIASHLLGLGDVSALSIAEVTAAQPDDSDIRYDIAIAETLHTGHPLVLTHVQRRPSDGAPRTFTTITEIIRNERDEPVRLQGRFVDITDDICRGEGLATADCIGIAECGSTVVVLVSGELDMANRTLLEHAMREAVSRSEDDLYVDARYLRFCEARAMGILVDAARGLRPSRQLVLLHPPKIVHRVLQIVATYENSPNPAVVVRTIPGLPDPHS